MQDEKQKSVYGEGVADAKRAMPMETNIGERIKAEMERPRAQAHNSWGCYSEKELAGWNEKGDVRFNEIACEHTINFSLIDMLCTIENCSYC